MTERNSTTDDAELLRLGREMDPLWDAEKAIAELDETPETDARFRNARDMSDCREDRGDPGHHA